SAAIVVSRSCSSRCDTASCVGSTPSASAKETALGLAALGALAGRARPNLPSPDSATHFVNSARTGSSTACPRSLASHVAQTTRLAWWQEAQLCSFFQASASLARKARPRSIVARTADGLGRGSWAEAGPVTMMTTRVTTDRMWEAPDAPGSNRETQAGALPRHVQSTQTFGIANEVLLAAAL